MYIANLEMTYGNLINMIELAKACNDGDDDPTQLDTLVQAVASDTAQANRLHVIRAVYPDYRPQGGDVSDMAPDEE